MARVLVLADLHWDHWQGSRIDPLAALGPEFWGGLDAVILAGDLCNQAADRWPRVFAAFGRHMDLAKLSVFPGNHDHYGASLDRGDKLRAACDVAGVRYAERQSFVLGSRRFLCCTLWTDMKLGGNAPLNMLRAQGVMNDYRSIRMASDGYRRLRPQDTVAHHQADLAWLDAELARPFDGQTVVVTHHAPIAPVPFTDLSAAYGSDLSQMILRLQPALWLYGHTHMPQADLVGQTEVRNVSLGYPEQWTGRRDGLAEHVARLVI